MLYIKYNYVAALLVGKGWKHRVANFSFYIVVSSKSRGRQKRKWTFTRSRLQGSNTDTIKNFLKILSQLKQNFLNWSRRICSGRTCIGRLCSLLGTSLSKEVYMTLTVMAHTHTHKRQFTHEISCISQNLKLLCLCTCVFTLFQVLRKKREKKKKAQLPS